MAFPFQRLQHSMASFQAQPEGPGLLLRRAALLVVHLKKPNHTPRALPCATAGSGATQERADDTPLAALNPPRLAR
ncbi:hypothetical protein CXP47_26795 [Pseudomonas chlororaphis]|nr:hypothetical protein CXP47_26795 [Pseudomonas chlororaphis]